MKVFKSRRPNLEWETGIHVESIWGMTECDKCFALLLEENIDAHNNWHIHLQNVENELKYISTLVRRG